MEKYEIVTRNIEEILLDDELKDIMKKKEPRIYCGYEVSGPVHIGTWANIRKLIDLQKSGFKVVVLLADYHTWLNLKGDMKWIEEMAKYWEKTFVACGLDPKKTEFVLGSKFQTKKEYLDDVLKLSINTTINRAVRSMQGIARDIEHAHVSQIIYPLMQIVDIKHLKLDAALGGMEQRKIHVLARENMDEINWKKPVCLHNELLVSLSGPEVKMSSSKPETMILLHEDPDVIRKRINKAFCPEKKTDGNPIMQIIKLHIFPEYGEFEIKRDEKFGGNKKFKSYKELEKSYVLSEIHPMDLKKNVAEYIIIMLKPVRDYFKKNKKYLKPLEKVK